MGQFMSSKSLNWIIFPSPLYGRFCWVPYVWVVITIFFVDFCNKLLNIITPMMMMSKMWEGITTYLEEGWSKLQLGCHISLEK